MTTNLRNTFFACQTGQGSGAVLTPESDGCLVALAVFKTVVGSFCEPRSVRFAPSPPISIVLEIPIENEDAFRKDAFPCLVSKS